jgi:NarL family two-component system response regulator LiaR
MRDCSEASGLRFGAQVMMGNGLQGVNAVIWHPGPPLLLNHRRQEYPADTMLPAKRSRYHPGIALKKSFLSRTSMEKSIRIVLANHHPIIRSDLRLLIERQPEFRVVGEAATGREAVVLAEYRRPDILLLDMKLPQANGMVAAREILSKKPGLGIIFVTVLTDEEYISEAFKTGARGYVLGDVVQTDLSNAIRVVAGGGTFLSPAISAKLIEEYVVKNSNDCVVSEHEKQLCCLLAAGYGEEEIVTRLHSTTSRVRADSQTVGDTLQRISVPQVIVDSIQRNHPLAGHP